MLKFQKLKIKKKHKPKGKKPKNIGFKERLASPKPSKPRICLRWSSTERMFNLKGKIITSSESECQSDCSKGSSNLFMVRRLGMLKAYDQKSEASHKFHLEVSRNGLGHNLFSVGQCCDSYLEVAFRRNTCFVRNLEGVDLLKGKRTTNLYTINLHEMASASPICLMALLLPNLVLLQAPVIIVRTDNGTGLIKPNGLSTIHRKLPSSVPQEFSLALIVSSADLPP
ncbi:hypothetical protein Tco_0287289 [Tanacetum coccineum]